MQRDVNFSAVSAGSAFNVVLADDAGKIPAA